MPPWVHLPHLATWSYNLSPNTYNWQNSFLTDCGPVSLPLDSYWLAGTKTSVAGGWSINNNYRCTAGWALRDPSDTQKSEVQRQDITTDFPFGKGSHSPVQKDAWLSINFKAKVSVHYQHAWHLTLATSTNYYIILSLRKWCTDSCTHLHIIKSTTLQVSLQNWLLWDWFCVEDTSVNIN